MRDDYNGYNLEADTSWFEEDEDDELELQRIPSNRQRSNTPRQQNKQPVRSNNRQQKQTQPKKSNLELFFNAVQENVYQNNIRNIRPDAYTNVEQQHVKKQQVKKQQTNSANAKKVNSNQKGKKNSKQVQQPKKSRLPLIILLVVVIGGVGVGAYMYFNNGKVQQPVETVPETPAYIPETTPAVPVDTYETLSQEIASLYTDELKTDVKQGVTVEAVQGILDRVTEGIGTNSQVVELEEELDTLKLFIYDKNTLSNILDSTYNLAVDNIPNICESVSTNTYNYRVIGLSAKIKELITQIENERNEYFNLKDELQRLIGSPDVVDFSEADYTERINAISHTTNRDELLAIYNRVVADKEVALATIDLQSATDEDSMAAAQNRLAEAQAKQDEAKEQLEAVNQTIGNNTLQASFNEPEMETAPTE